MSRRSLDNAAAASAFGNAMLRYTGRDLDRSALYRKDTRWLAEQFASSSACIIPVWRNLNLFESLDGVAGAPRIEFLSTDRLSHHGWSVDDAYFLGVWGEQVYFAIDASLLAEPAADELHDAAEFADLRVAGPLLSLDDAALCAYARGLSYWHRHNGYCADCGNPTRSEQGGHARRCTACNRQVFPRTDPAVIMLVVASDDAGPDRCLLGRDPRWPPGTFSTLAGFVETGESLEQAVAREVFEEAGVIVTDVQYVASQPWPFPASIMLGFRARALSTELRLDLEEVEDACWFTAQEIATFGEWGDESAPLRVPRRDSIARYLIDTWVADQRADSRR